MLARQDNGLTRIIKTLSLNCIQLHLFFLFSIGESAPFNYLRSCHNYLFDNTNKHLPFSFSTNNHFRIYTYQYQSRVNQDSLFFLTNNCGNQDVFPHDFVWCQHEKITPIDLTSLNLEHARGWNFIGLRLSIKMRRWEVKQWEDKELNKEHFHPFRAIWCITSTGQKPDFIVWLRFHINGGDCYK